MTRMAKNFLVEVVVKEIEVPVPTNVCYDREMMMLLLGRMQMYNRWGQVGVPMQQLSATTTPTTTKFASSSSLLAVCVCVLINK